MEIDKMCKKIDIILTLLTAHLRKTIQESDYHFLDALFGQDGPRLSKVAELEQIVDELQRRLEVDFIEWPFEQLRAHFDYISNGLLYEINEIQGVSRNEFSPDVLFQFFCATMQIDLKKYEKELQYFHEYVRLYSLLVKIKYFLRKLNLKEQFEELIEALHTTYHDQMKGPDDTRAAHITNTIHGLNLMCERLSRKLNDKNYQVTDWILKKTNLIYSKDKTAESIEKWINVLPNNVAKSLNTRNVYQPHLIFFKNKVDRTAHLAKLEREKFDNFKLVERLYKSKAKAIRIKDISAALDRKFARRLERARNLETRLGESADIIHSHRLLAESVIGQMVNVKNTVLYVKVLMEEMNFRSPFDEMESDSEILSYFSFELIKLIDFYAKYFTELETLEQQLKNLSNEKCRREEAKYKLHSHIDAVLDFWESSKKVMLGISDQYETLSREIEPDFSIGHSIIKHWYWIVMGTLLMGAIFTLLGLFVFTLPPIELAIIITCGLIIGACIAGGFVILKEYLQATSLHELTPEDVSKRLGKLPNETTLDLTPFSEDPFEVELKELKVEF